MREFFTDNGKIGILISVSLLIFGGLAWCIINISRKVSKMERDS